MANLSILKQKIKERYLNPNGADFWFLFGDEKIPAHKFILETMSPWLDTMLNGSLPVENEVNMDSFGVSVKAFKEFLRFIYSREVNFTMDNIEEIMNLAKMSLVEEFFLECENFLIEKLTIENMFFGYQLALLYEANRLKKICEEEIGFYAAKVLKSSTFLNFQYDFLENVLMCDTLTCEEKEIFDACIAWAKAACKRNNKDPTKGEYLRAQLKNALYHIRFCAMTKEEAADCISSCPRLFAIEELEEIICMIGRKTEYEPKNFNWTTRNLKLDRKHKRNLACSRFQFYNRIFSYLFSYTDPITWSSFVSYDFNEIERTTFTSTKLVMLNGFTCEGFQHRLNPLAEMQRYSVNVKISKRNPSDDNDIDELFNETMLLHFAEKRKFLKYPSKMAHVKLEPAILIRPKQKYTIEIQFRTQPQIRNHCVLKSRVRVDHNVIVEFDGKRGAISSLNISQIDKVNYFRKVLRNPKVYLAILMLSFFTWLYLNPSKKYTWSEDRAYYRQYGRYRNEDINYKPTIVYLAIFFCFLLFRADPI